MSGARELPAVLVSRMRTAFLEALALTSVELRPRPCEHEEIEVIRGNLVHCKCGLAIEVPCQHIFVERILPKVWRCIDCREWRGEGGKA